MPVFVVAFYYKEDEWCILEVRALGTKPLFYLLSKSSKQISSIICFPSCISPFPFTVPASILVCLVSLCISNRVSSPSLHCLVSIRVHEAVVQDGGRLSVEDTGRYIYLICVSLGREQILLTWVLMALWKWEHFLFNIFLFISRLNNSCICNNLLQTPYLFVFIGSYLGYRTIIQKSCNR